VALAAWTVIVRAVTQFVLGLVMEQLFMPILHRVPQSEDRKFQRILCTVFSQSTRLRVFIQLNETKQHKSRTGDHQIPKVKHFSQAGMYRFRSLSGGLRIPENGLEFEKFLDARLTPLAPISRLLLAAEASTEVQGRSVHVDVARANSPVDTAGVLEIARGHEARKTVNRAIGDSDGIVFVPVPMMDKTGPKISSRAIVMSLRTSENTVGLTK
jgi:hypothetical protein